MEKRLTNELLEQLVKESGSRLEVRDLGCPGLSLRIAGNGKWGTWNWRFGHGGRRVQLGRWPGISLKVAHDLAAIQRGKVAQGVDPIILRREAKAAITLEALASQFRRDHLPSLGVRTQKEYGALLDNEIIPRLGKVKARDLDRPAVAKWHQGMRDTPRQANHALAVLSKMMSLAEFWGHRTQGRNPCKGVPRFPENKRQRYLNPEELARVAAALPDSPAGDAIRLMILTGLRVGEALALTWPMVDLKAEQATLPAEAHKNGRKKGAKTVLLPAAAKALLESLPRSVRGQVVLATLGQIEHAWKLVRKEAEVPGVRPHDLRHSFVSWGAAQGLSLPTLGALVGHSEAATTQRYAHLSQSPLRAAVEQIGAALAAAMEAVN